VERLPVLRLQWRPFNRSSRHRHHSTLARTAKRKARQHNCRTPKNSPRKM